MSSLPAVLASMGLAVLASACTSPSPGTATHDGVTAPPAASASTSPAPTATTPPPTPPTPGGDPRAAVPCTTNADCGWDDDCVPTRCVEAHPPQACDESTPPPGTCECMDGRCTLRPKSARPPTGP